MTDNRVSQANLFEVGERNVKVPDSCYVTAILDENRKEEMQLIKNYYLYNTHTIVVIMATE